MILNINNFELLIYKINFFREKVPLRLLGLFTFTKMATKATAKKAAPKAAKKAAPKAAKKTAVKAKAKPKTKK